MCCVSRLEVSGSVRLRFQLRALAKYQGQSGLKVSEREKLQLGARLNRDP